MFKNKKILVLAPHTDDGELGAGATIAKAIEEGAEVYYAAFSTAGESVPKEFPKDILKYEVKDATSVLGVPEENIIIYDYLVRKLSYVRQEILEDMVKLKRELNPDIVFMPCQHDIHQDHLTVSNEGLRAFKNTTILGYELIWNNLSFNTTSFVKVEKKHLDKKFQALQQYKSQGQRKYMSKDFIYSLATTRGVQVGADYAEAFEVIRLIVN